MLLRALIATSIMLFGLNSQAQPDYPNRPIRVIVGYGAGGNADAYARQLSEHMAKALGQPIVVENKPGATGVIATKYVAESKPDGYTLLFTSNSSMTAMPAIRLVQGQSIGYRVPEDFSFIGLAYEAPAGIFVGASSKLNSIDDFKAISQSRQIQIGTPGAGGASELLLELINARLGTKAIGVPYQSVSQALPDILSGRVEGFIGNFGTLKPLFDQGKLKLIGLMADSRTSSFPKVATFKEYGADVVATGLFGFVAPAGTPPDILKRLSTALSAAIRDPATVALVAPTGVDVKDLPLEQFRDYITKEKTWYIGSIRSLPGIEKRLMP